MSDGGDALELIAASLKMSKSTSKASDAKVLATEPLMIKDARWTRLVLYALGGPLLWTDETYILNLLTGPHTETRSESSAYGNMPREQYATRPEDSPIDGVGIVAILQRSSGPELLLQKQFRPPVDKTVIEIPAGLVDPGESAADSAVRELREETGYHGVVSEVSPIMFNGTPFWKRVLDRIHQTKRCLLDPGFCNTNLNMVHVTIDMSLPENQNLKPELEENEFIEVFSLPLRDLYAGCKRFEEEGYAIDARVGTLAEGIELAKRWKL
ncbi:MAG: hypothetical protein Q9228_001803 [Teloschistes exilis]